ncbi:hypothetical protein PV328_008175 [Microctonus aethiopoides]|uniref:Uncharacterized protein n=1 Tax=Microctonus aethiopoides TaxID=144406 RepID=A0AA39CA87_9HYME|nr:hypothetical protein PV328_008175 [Microctonus aethiopoides]
MEICPVSQPPRERPRSIITIKNAIGLGHDESCNCCCCSNPEPEHRKYIQPEIPKSFKPIKSYRRNEVPMEQNTTYKLSYLNGPIPTASALKPVLPQDSLTVGDGTMTSETIHKLSYLGNWFMKRDAMSERFERKSPLRTAKQWLGRGPMQNDTTHKNDFTWKCIPISKPSKLSNNLYCLGGTMSGDTTYKLSYYGSNCRIPVKSFKPKVSKEYKKNDVPFEGYTTYRLSYWPNNNHPVCRPFKPNKTTQNISNVNGGFNDKTAYNLSETAKINSQWRTAEQQFGEGPIQNMTTHNHDFTCKHGKSNCIYTCPKDNLGFSSLPLECCSTCNFSCCLCGINNLVKDKSFEPGINHKDPLNQRDGPMEGETTIRLNYQPVEVSLSQSKLWMKNSKYHPSAPPIDEDATYNSSYIPVGASEEPLDCNESYPPMSDDTYEGSCNNPLSQSSSSMETEYCAP